MPKTNFIYTTDKETANKLINLGLKLLYTSNGIYTFINDVTSNFEQIDNNKIIKTNKLLF